MRVTTLDELKALPVEQQAVARHVGLATVVIQDGPSALLFWCPGCDMAHRVTYGSGAWEWNESVSRPTISPSINVTWHEGEAQVPKRCHSFVTDGRIEFLNDSTHHLAGKTVVLQPFDWGR